MQHADCILISDWNVNSRSTFDRVWSTSFPDVKIPASNRFSKCETCERLKRMIHTGEIEAGHNMKPEEYETFCRDKVCMNSSVEFLRLIIDLFK